MLLRIRPKTEPQTVQKKPEPTKGPDRGATAPMEALRAEIKELRAEIAQLKLAPVAASQEPVSTAPWTFDVERDSYGRSTEVKAHKDVSHETNRMLI